MNNIESVLYEVSKFFLTPVLIMLCLMFAYALFGLGCLIYESARRRSSLHGSSPLATYLTKNPGASVDELELQVIRRIEVLRLTSRIAPMLGLVATMIPMGPALIAVSAGNAQGMAENLVVAFSAVIVALLASSMTFFTQTIRKRWLLEELTMLANTQKAL